MGAVVVDITMSLDGFVTGPNDESLGLGEGGEVLHYWVFGGPWTYDETREMKPVGVDKDALDQAIETGGASIVGRRMYDATGGWGGKSPFNMPTFVVTHRTGDQPEADSGFRFVDGVEAAVAAAREVAGEKKIGIGGGASIVQQAFAADLVDELNLHIAPVILGAGRPLFGELAKRVLFDPVEVTQSDFATHLRFRVRSK